MENKTLEKQIRPSVFELTPYVPAKPVEEMREELGLSRIVKLSLIHILQSTTSWMMRKAL